MPASTRSMRSPKYSASMRGRSVVVRHASFSVDLAELGRAIIAGRLLTIQLLAE
jgi:hypothetical protein